MDPSIRVQAHHQVIEAANAKCGRRPQGRPSRLSTRLQEADTTYDRSYSSPSNSASPASPNFACHLHRDLRRCACCWKVCFLHSQIKHLRWGEERSGAWIYPIVGFTTWVVQTRYHSTDCIWRRMFRDAETCVGNSVVSPPRNSRSTHFIHSSTRGICWGWETATMDLMSSLSNSSPNPTHAEHGANLPVCCDVGVRGCPVV